MYLNFKIHFGPSSFFVLINTNPDELSEFSNEFIGARELVVTLLFFIPLLRLNSITSAILNVTYKFKFVTYKFLKLGACTLLFLTVFKFTRIIDHNLPYLICRSFILNHKDKKFVEDFNSQIETNNNSFKNKNNNLNNTFVVVIGESVTSSHMQLYGYYRNTTPFFQKIKDSLSIYEDVISPNTSTFHSLSKALTLGNYEDPKKVLALPITTLFNKSGFKTFWISNHSPAFNPGSALARVSGQAQLKFFNSKAVVMGNLKHDGELLDKVDEALKDDFSHKIIFLHLIGAHFSYENRYPEEFNVFSDKPKTKFKDEMAYQKINQYDNAVRYSDFILNKVLQKLKTEKANSYLMYFSDHGEEVFQDEDFYGHLEDKPTKNTFKIPFIMWYSNHFKYPKDYSYKKKRKYMTDDLWHSIVHISGLKNSFLDKRRSIFSSEFVNRKRLILEGENYETFFE
ncbi:phosphoethanolamine transferase [Flavivirga algicola]|uniref:Phosphoethanolamine transferase n=1 Tax=Flavivirga algicola TaxID=2729136 RepID=A0ABX1S097_9FLAO|nr:phosphoethanolamine transferase [Flavivirga algicola]NMH88015.1 phosphoethanolamine transferase [Flavivirga algicola]